MTEPRIASAIAVKTPESLKELMSFLRLMNCFRDHIRNHSTHAHHLHDMVSAANRKIVKMITWTAAGKTSFKTLKDLVNECTKLFFIKIEYKIVLYADASDGTCLCQVIPASEYEEPIHFLSGSFPRRSNTVRASVIYWAHGKLDDLFGGMVFIIRMDHRNLLYMNNHGARRVLQLKLDIQHYDALIELDEYASRCFQQTGRERRDNSGKPCHDTDMLPSAAGHYKNLPRMAMRPQRSRQDPSTNDTATP
jgi:hypothetical protein